MRRATPMPDTSVQGVSRGLVSVALVWLPLWILAQPGLWPSNQPGLGAALALYSLVPLWLALLVVHLRGMDTRWPNRLLVVGLLAATVAVNIGQLRIETPDVGVVAEMAALAAGISGLLLPWRWGLAGIALLVAPLARDVASEVGPLPDLLVPIAYVLTMGLSALAVRHALLRNAAAADSAADAVLAIELQRQTVEQVAAMLHQTERLLHETVLNTLVALGRGVAASAADSALRLRERCAESARVLGALRTRAETGDVGVLLTGDLATDVAGPLQDLRSAGVIVEWQVEGLESLPAEVYAATRSAVAEALLNIRRHAHAHQVRVSAQVTGARTRSRLRVSVSDDGVGFEDSGSAERFGVTEAILASMADVHGSASVSGEPGGGTTVLLEWSRSDEHREDVVTPAAIAVPLLAAIGLYLAVLIPVTWTTMMHVGVNALALLLFIAAAALVIERTRRDRLSWPVVAALALMGWAVYALQQSAAGPDTSPEWASSAVAVLFLATAATGPRWAWVLLVAVWLVFQGDPLHELTQPGTVLILVGALLGRSTRRNARLALVRRAERTHAAVRRQAARDQVDRLASRYGALAESAAPELLSALASGSLSPADPQVREQAVREEAFLRNVMRLDPEEDVMHRLASDLARAAHARGVLLEVSLLIPADEMGRPPEGFAESCLEAMQHAAVTVIVDGQPVGATARLTSRSENGRSVMRLVLPMERGWASTTTRPGSAGCVAGELLDPDDAAGAVSLWEASVSDPASEGGTPP